MLREPGLHEDVRCGAMPRGFFADRAAMTAVNLSSLGTAALISQGCICRLADVETKCDDFTMIGWSHLFSADRSGRLGAWLPVVVRVLPGGCFFENMMRGRHESAKQGTIGRNRRK